MNKKSVSPRESTSLTPRSFVSIDYDRSGLNESNSPVRTKEILGILWERRNEKVLPRGVQPIRTIIHEMLPARLGKPNSPLGMLQHDGLWYVREDVRISSSVVRWLGSDIGDAVLTRLMPGADPERFLKGFTLEMQRLGVDLVALVTHSCTSRCGRKGTARCMLEGRPVSRRKRALVECLFLWLGRPDGQSFLAAYVACKESASKAHIIHGQCSAGRNASYQPIRREA